MFLSFTWENDLTREVSECLPSMREALSLQTQYYKWIENKIKLKLPGHSFRGSTPWLVDPVVLGLWWGSRSWWVLMPDQSHWLVPGVKENRKNLGSHNLLWGTLQWPQALLLGGGSTTFQCTTLGTKCWTHGPLEDIQEPNYSMVRHFCIHSLRSTVIIRPNAPKPKPSYPWLSAHEKRRLECGNLQNVLSQIYSNQAFS
jgi:hypothetical protein